GVPDVQVASMKVGAAQAVHVDAVPGPALQGRITRVAPSADPSGKVFEVEVTLPNRDGRLKAGMIAWLEVGAAPAAVPTLLSVPLNAVIRPPGQLDGYAVFVVDTGRGASIARLRPVTFGGIHGDRIEVTSGLRGGERVIVRGATLAVDSQTVR